MAVGSDIDSGVEILDVVARTQNLPDQGLQRGQVGTIVEILKPGVFEVEFSDDDGHAYALVAVTAEHLLVWHDDPVH